MEIKIMKASIFAVAWILPVHAHHHMQSNNVGDI